MFRILVIDDDPAAGYLLQKCVNKLPDPPDLFLLADGADALRYLRGEGAYKDTLLPNLILLDLHLPPLDGLELLGAIKEDPRLKVIPVIVFSTSDHPADIYRSYLRHANCYVQKPADLGKMVQFVQCMATFWGHFARPPSTLPTPGPGIASERPEANSRAMTVDTEAGIRKAPSGSGCAEHDRLLDEFGEAVREVLQLHEQQFKAIVDGDGESNRFDLLIHMANEHKQNAKYAYLRHVQSHGCANTNVVDKT
jgi:CheY-like chemotaxis protein